ncbi:conserved hypothetical protein [Pediculus humanus corporis]|uniref:Uncharacterized protein n=1 Tax=Pediculus humanus subsp. corporis TaxID=121224 RepID=E0W1M6_PEDHC|nr:uncharacterized protein Phum_PHUM579220 [Pediculus humanus corporis]EEB19532.1 conserved hypothetical protein [Pediculus humanus corporis]
MSKKILSVSLKDVAVEFAQVKVVGAPLTTTESWTGRWFPDKPTTPKPKINIPLETHRMPMGDINPECDDGKVNTTIDWDGSILNYICMNPRNRFVPDESIESIIEFENIPEAYEAPHFCMDTKIKYTQSLPTFGPHRPLWPVYGEYEYLPKERWLHTLEHGGIVALYHPCADLMEIKLLKNLVKTCLRRHVISPSVDLTKERPFALLAWGVRFTMSTVYPNSIRQFIKEKALKGPEKLSDDGQFNLNLIEKALIVSNIDDNDLCPDKMK